jgi:hypothetical protein
LHNENAQKRQLNKLYKNFEMLISLYQESRREFGLVEKKNS